MSGDGERITHPSELKDLEWTTWNLNSVPVSGYPMLGMYPSEYWLAHLNDATPVILSSV